ncbi:diguanylate cyclase [Vibrio sp. S11_S32]|uniref:diguanylate cyclase domain-containing protein n=1 Tax=Vibrio sp. S11_S32 TaxID=2720225 RepID=UPI0016815320|nr:diguanylate cyclase [Vibrio sp. S11_S32]MBD1577895.1 diguanylate cyclase [Vibrio sp. S11_S32]
MNKKTLPSIIIIIIVLISIWSITYTTTQFYNVDKCLTNTIDAIFTKTVDASYDIIDTTINESLKNYLRGIAVTMKDMLDASKNMDLNQNKINHFLDKFVAETRIGDNGYISILNNKGTLLTHPYLKGKNLAEDNFIQTQLSNDQSMTEYKWKNPGEKEARLKVAYSMKLSNGNVINVSVYKDEMVKLVDRELLKQKLEKYNFGKTGYVYVVDSHGRLVLHPTNEGQSIRVLIGDSTDDFLAAVKKKPEGSFTYPLTINNKTIMKTVAYKYYPYLDWIIASGISNSELKQPTNLLSKSLIMAGLSFAMIISILICILSKRHNKLILAEKKDFLTGLNNRRRFMELAQVVEQTSSNIYSIVLFDIDKFKNINDTYGHGEGEGDEVIREVAHVLKQFESSNVFVSRHGGEEFILLLNDIDEIEAKSIAEGIRIRISKITSLKCRFTISGGVFEADSDKHNLTEAIAFADEGLYEAKESGRNKVVIKHT